MFIPLRDNKAHIEELCARLRLGDPQNTVTSLSGGFHHRVWRLDTHNGCFVVKQLAPDTDLHDDAVIRHYNVTEAIANEFAKHGIAAVSALRCGESYLQLIDEEAYLVFPWTDAVALGDGKVSTRRAMKVAQLLARMHAADIQIPGVESQLAEPSESKDVEGILDIASESGLAIAPLLREHRSLLMRVARQYHEALTLLQRRQVVSHGDLDQKNVLWDSDDNPVIIDWESAHKLNPTREVIHEALDWSGVTAEFDQVLYTRFVAAYVEAGGHVSKDLIEAALHCILGEWLDWLLYNVGRIVNLEGARQHVMGEEQVEFILPVMVKLDHLQPQLLHDLPWLAVAQSSAAPS